MAQKRLVSVESKHTEPRAQSREPVNNKTLRTQESKPPAKTHPIKVKELFNKIECVPSKKKLVKSVSMNYNRSEGIRMLNAQKEEQLRTQNSLAYKMSLYNYVEQRTWKKDSQVDEDEDPLDNLPRHQPNQNLELIKKDLRIMNQIASRLVISAD